MGVTVAILIEASLAEVWTAVADLASHTEWMADAEEIKFSSEQREGVGTRMEVLTRIGPLTTTDIMEVTGWEYRRRVAVRHEGLVGGDGDFRLQPVGGGVVITWTERLKFPWQFGGPLGAVLAQPLFRWIWKRNLLRLKERLERSSAPGV